MGVEIPEEGENHSGKWWKGKRDREGNEIPPSHKNARFTVSLEHFPNVDLEALHNPCGVEIGGMIFGGRDRDTWPPVREAFDWKHGVITMGASLESETTAATLGKEGVRAFNPMAILDFMSVPLVHRELPEVRREAEEGPEDIRRQLLPPRRERQLAQPQARQSGLAQVDGVKSSRRR